MRQPKGFALLEVMIVCVVLLTLAAIAVPNVVQMQRSQFQQQAKQRVQLVSWAESTIALCSLNPGCNPGPAFPLIPQQQIMQIGQYNFYFNVFGPNWTYSAIPLNPQWVSYYEDQTAVLHCATGAANGASPVCN
jgi:prepilin-type N-terminal cleavage/methylation domain-containing protein